MPRIAGRLGSKTFAGLLIAALALAPAFPAYSESRPDSTAQASPALHLMNETEFATFLSRFNAAQLHWEEELKSLDARSLSLNLEREDRAALEQSYGLCLESLNMMGQQARELSRKQTMRGDLLLLVDMDDLARNLDELDRDLASASAAAQYDAAPKALSYVREILGINTALAASVAEFQNHVFAFAKLIDARLAETDEDPPAPLPHS